MLTIRTFDGRNHPLLGIYLRLDGLHGRRHLGAFNQKAPERMIIAEYIKGAACCEVNRPGWGLRLEMIEDTDISRSLTLRESLSEGYRGAAATK